MHAGLPRSYRELPTSIVCPTGLLFERTNARGAVFQSSDSLIPLRCINSTSTVIRDRGADDGDAEVPRLGAQ